MDKVKAKTVRELLIKKLLTPKEEKETSIVYAFFNQFEELKEALKKQQEFTIMKSNENVNAPFYRNNSGYKAEIENGKIKSLVAHYYINAQQLYK